MKEAGFDISKNKTKSVYDPAIEVNHTIMWSPSVMKQAQRCPVFPGKGKRFHWGFETPRHFGRSRGTRLIRDRILTKVKEWISEQS